MKTDAPTGRRIVSLGEIAEFRNGVNFVASQRGAGIPVLNVKDFQDRSQPNYSGLEELKRDAVRVEALLRSGDILFVRSNGNKELIGRSMFVEVAPARPTTHSAFTIRARITSPEADPQYCAYVMRGGVVRVKLSAQGSGTNISNLNQDILSQLQIWLPPLEIQRRIARILSTYDDLIEVNARRISILDEIARRLFHEWFVNLRYPIKYRVGKAETVRLGLTVDFAKGKKPTETRKHPREDDVQLLLIDALRGGNAEYTSPSAMVLADNQDTVMVMDGASSCDVAIGFSGVVGSTLGRFRTTRSERLSGYALYRFLESKTDEFKSKNVGSAIPHANKDYILTQMVSLPPQRVNEQFDSLSKPIHTEIEILRVINRRLRTARDLLLPKLISGEIDLSGGPAEKQAAAE